MLNVTWIKHEEQKIQKKKLTKWDNHILSITISGNPEISLTFMRLAFITGISYWELDAYFHFSLYICRPFFFHFFQ